jgi:hypothetical protein
MRGREERNDAMPNFPAHGGDLVHLVFLVFLDSLNRKNQIGQTHNMVPPHLVVLWFILTLQLHY